MLAYERNACSLAIYFKMIKNVLSKLSDVIPMVTFEAKATDLDSHLRPPLRSSHLMGEVPLPPV